MPVWLRADGALQRNVLKTINEMLETGKVNWDIKPKDGKWLDDPNIDDNGNYIKKNWSTGHGVTFSSVDNIGEIVVTGKKPKKSPKKGGSSGSTFNTKLIAFNPEEIVRDTPSIGGIGLGSGFSDWEAGLRNAMGMNMEKTRDWGKEIGKVFADYVADPYKDKRQKGVKEKSEFSEFSNQFSQITGAVSGIFSGIEQLGIELPEGIKNVLGGIQAIAGILTAISSLIAIITTIQGAKAVPVVGFLLANGGIAHAANGYTVPGNNFSGDMVPAMLNSGELVLNKAQQGNLASQLQGGGMQNMRLTATVTGEDIILSVNNTLKRKNRGELATWR